MEVKGGRLQVTRYAPVRLGPAGPGSAAPGLTCNCLCSRGWQKDYRRDPKRGSDVYCWFVHNSGKGFIDGRYSDYIMADLNSFLQTA